MEGAKPARRIHFRVSALQGLGDGKGQEVGALGVYLRSIAAPACMVKSEP